MINEILFVGLDYEEDSLKNGVTWNWVDSAGVINPEELTCNNFGLLDYDYLVYLTDFIYLDNLIKKDTRNIEKNIKNNKDILFNALFCNIESDDPKHTKEQKCINDIMRRCLLNIIGSVNGNSNLNCTRRNMLINRKDDGFIGLNPRGSLRLNQGLSVTNNNREYSQAF